MSEPQQERRSTQGVGPKVNKNVPSKRVKAEYRRTYFQPNPRYNELFEAGLHNPRLVKVDNAPSLREFALKQGYADWFTNKRTLARQTMSSYRAMKKLPPREKNIKTRKGEKKGKSGG